MSLTFNAAAHRYDLDGARLPSVTSILRPLQDFGSVPADVLSAAAEFGSAVHLACELHDQGDLDTDTLDPALMPYLMAWQAFCREHDARWEMIEQPLYHTVLRYAGTLDRFGLVDGIPAVVDLKTTARLYPVVGPQLAAYQHALQSHNVQALRRLAVRLREDGTYHAQEYMDTTDWPLFCSLLTVRGWCQRHRLNTPNLTHTDD